MDETILSILVAVFNGVMLMTGILLGTKLTSRTLTKEIDRYTEKSEMLQTLKKVLMKVEDEKLVEKIVVFFEEATTLVSSEEAKNFFKNATEALKEFSSSESDIKVNLPKKPEEIK